METVDKVCSCRPTRVCLLVFQDHYLETVWFKVLGFECEEYIILIEANILRIINRESKEITFLRGTMENKPTKLMIKRNPIIQPMDSFFTFSGVFPLSP